jgi:hypothetical protein
MSPSRCPQILPVKATDRPFLGQFVAAAFTTVLNSSSGGCGSANSRLAQVSASGADNAGITTLSSSIFSR